MTRDVDYELRLPYAVDTINAVKAVKSSKLPYLDKNRVGWLGRSMGGGVTLTALVAQPGLVDAAVIYASVSSLAADNWKQFYRPSEDRSRTNRRMARTYGLPDESPEFWRAASARPYLDRVDRAAAGAPRHQRRHLPDSLVRSNSQDAQGSGQGRHLYQVPGRGSHLRPPVEALNRANHGLFRQAPELGQRIAHRDQLGVRLSQLSGRI